MPPSDEPSAEIHFWVWWDISFVQCWSNKMNESETRRNIFLLSFIFYALQEVVQSGIFLLNKQQSLHNIIHWSVSQQAIAFLLERTYNSNTTEYIEMPMTGLKSISTSFYLPSHPFPQINPGCRGRALQKHFQTSSKCRYSKKMCNKYCLL